VADDDRVPHATDSLLYNNWNGESATKTAMFGITLFYLFFLSSHWHLRAPNFDYFDFDFAQWKPSSNLAAVSCSKPGSGRSYIFALLLAVCFVILIFNCSAGGSLVPLQDGTREYQSCSAHQQPKKTD
jgi:hypothetical protein